MNNIRKIAQPQKWLLTLFAFVILLKLCGCIPPYLGDTKEVTLDLDIRYYSFDSTSILDLLNNGNSDVFTLLETDPQPRSSVPSIPLLKVSWTQADFLRVAQAVQQLVWKESSDALDLADASFELNCLDVEQGVFSEAVFEFYKLIPAGDMENRIQYIIRISPSENYIRTSRAEISPNMRVLTPLDLDQHPTTAEKALEIAEESGGADEKAYYKNNNPCMITAMVDETQGWQVFYQTWDVYSWRYIYSIDLKPPF
jgi:hypothetical protein